MLMKTRDIGDISQQVQTKKKKIEKLTVTLHSFDDQPSNRCVYYAEDREETEELASKASECSNLAASENLPSSIRRGRQLPPYRELEARKSRARDLEKLYMDMAMQKELQVFIHLRFYVLRIQDVELRLQENYFHVIRKLEGKHKGVEALTVFGAAFVWVKSLDGTHACVIPFVKTKVGSCFILF